MTNLHQIFVRVTCGRGSVLFWQRCNKNVMYFQFVDDVMFAHNGSYGGVLLALQWR